MSQDILISLIDPDPEQPRKRFDTAAIDELAQSLASNGVAVPILLRPVGERFEIVHGERRWRAARSLGWETIAAEVRNLTPQEAGWLTLVENIQRADLTPIEEGEAYRQRLDTGITQAELGERIGKSQSYIAQKLRVLRLPGALQLLIQEKALSEGHARQLLKLRAIYGDELVADFPDEYEQLQLDTKLSEDEAWCLLSWSLLNEIRPEERPPQMFLYLMGEDGRVPMDEPSKQIARACRAFVTDIRAHRLHLPQWMSAAFWWGITAVYSELSVGDLALAIDRWRERFYSSIYYLSVTPNYVHSQADVPIWFGHQADLRHSNALSVLDHKTPETFAVFKNALETFKDKSGYTLPSEMQTWATSKPTN